MSCLLPKTPYTLLQRAPKHVLLQDLAVPLVSPQKFNMAIDPAPPIPRLRPDQSTSTTKVP